VAFDSITLFQGSISTVLIFWTFLQPYLLPLVQFTVLSL
jgi:hypothetical protein